MSHEQRKFIQPQVEIIEHPVKEVVAPEVEQDTVTKTYKESPEKAQLREDFLTFESLLVDGEVKKAWEIIEENGFYGTFSQYGKSDPFMEFEEYIRKATGVGIYKTAGFPDVFYGELGGLIGTYKTILDTVTNNSYGERQRLEIIDQKLVHFLEDRINHFLKTIKQRIHDVALHRTGAENDQARIQLEKQLFEKLSLSQKKEDMMNLLADVDTRKKAVYQFKGHTMVQLCRELSTDVNEVLKDPTYSDPLIPDAY